MDEMLSIALWVMITFITVSATVGWFTTQINTENSLVGNPNNIQIGLNGYAATSFNTNDFRDTPCTMTVLTDLPGYAYCSSIGKIMTPLGYWISALWGLLTNWQILLTAIFVSVPGGSLFAGLLIPFLSIMEAAAAFIIIIKVGSVIAGLR